MRTVMLPVDVSVSFVLENHVHVTRAAVVTKNTFICKFYLRNKKIIRRLVYTKFKTTITTLPAWLL